MEMVPVNSTNVAAVGYEAEEKRLVVQFQNGTSYAYANVPADVHQEMMGAPSVGRYLNQVVKPEYRATKL